MLEETLSHVARAMNAVLCLSKKNTFVETESNGLKLLLTFVEPKNH